MDLAQKASLQLKSFSMKRPLSLIEVTIGLALTAILLTTLFSCFRELVKVNIEVERLCFERHWENVMQLRLNTIFESINKNCYFKTEPYEDISKNALHFTFNNGVDVDPNFCKELEGYLFQDDQSKNFCLIIEPSTGEKRTEIFVKNTSDFFMRFFDPVEAIWKTDWDQKYLPPIVKIFISGKEFLFFLPHGNRTAVYS